MIGKKLSAVYEEVEKTLWEFEAESGMKPGFTSEGFRAATKIFTSALMDKIFELQEKESISIEDRMKMAFKAGDDVRKLIKTYTGIETMDFYKESHENK